MIAYLGRVRAEPRRCELYPGICLTTEEKARKNLSQGTCFFLGNLRNENQEMHCIYRTAPDCL